MNHIAVNPNFDLTAFHLNTVGLPDRQIFDSAGKPSEDVLQKRLGLSRKYRRFLASNKKKYRTITLYGNRKARANGFCYQTKAFQKLDSNFMVAGDDRISWETLVFQEFYPGWHLLAGKDKHDEPLDALTFPEADIRNTLKKRFKLAVGSDGSAKIFQCSVLVLEKVNSEIYQWDILDEGRKALIADVVFGLFTLFGPELLQEIVSGKPEILKYYSHVIKQNSTIKPPELAIESVRTATEVTTKDQAQVVISEHQDLTSFYMEISKIGANGIENFEDISIAERLEYLVVNQLPRLKENVGFSERKFEVGITKFVSKLMKSGKKTNLSPFTDPGFEGAFKTTWIAYLVNIFKTEIPPDYFEKVIGQTKNINSIIAEYDIARSALNSTRIKIADLLLSFEKANFGLRLELKTTLASERMHEAQLSQDLNVIENKVISAFLPPNVPVSEMSEDTNSIKIRPKEYHKSASIALRLFLENSDRNETNEPTENVVLEPSVNENRPEFSEGAISKLRDAYLSTNVDEIKIIPIVEALSGTVENIPDNALEINRAPSESVPRLLQSATTKQEVDSNKPQDVVVDNEATQNLKSKIHSEIESHEFAKLEIDSSEPNDLESNDLSFATDILSEVYPAEYEEDAEIAGERVHQCYKHRGIISHLHAENIALHWMKKSQLNAAFATLSVSRSLEFIEGEGLSPVLIRAAYFGQHVWPGDMTSVATIQRELNFLGTKQIDDQMSKKPGGKIVPYLLFASALQPALFAGHYTNAPNLLRQIKNEFEEETNKLINEVVIFSDQGHRLDLETLRKQPQTHGNQHRKKLLARLSDWRDRIINKQTGWAPARIAMTNCLKRQEFLDAINIIENSQTEQSSRVQDFLDLYSDQSAITALMEEEVKKARVGYHDVAVIERNALVWFQNSVLDIRDIATSWLIDHQIVPSRTDAIQAFSPRFVNQLRAVQTELQRYSNLSVSFDQSCGIAIVLGMVANLLSVIDGNINGIWEGKRAIAHFNLPPLLIGSTPF